MSWLNRLLSDRNRAVWPTAFASLFVVIIFLLGGASRGDVLSLPILRAFAGAILVLLLVLVWPRLAVARPHLIFLSVVAAVILLQLVPFPFEFWSALPGRQVQVELDAAAKLGQLARPVTFDPFSAWNTLFSLLIPAASLATFVLVNERGQRQLLGVLLVILGFAMVIGLGQLVSGGDSALYLYRITNRDSAVGFLANRNHHALLLSCILPLLALWLSSTSGKVDQVRLYQLVAVVGVAFTIPSIVMTGSRAGLILMVIGLAAAVAVYRAPTAVVQRRDRKIELFDVRKLAAGAIALGLVASWSTGRLTAFDRLDFQSASEVDRLAMLPTLWEMAVEYFPFGGGAGSFVALFRMHEPFDLLNSSYYNHAHNDVLEVLIEFGVIGLILMICAILWWFRAALRLVRSTVERRSGFVWQAGHCGLWILLMCAIASIADYPLRVPAVQMVACLAVIWVTLASRGATSDVVNRATQ